MDNKDACIYLSLYPLFESEVNKNLLIQHKQSLETNFMINDSKKIKSTSNQLNVFCFKQD